MRSFKYLKSIFKLKPMYYFINLSSLWEFEWYASQLRKIADIEYCDIHTYPQNTPHYSTPIQIYDEIPYSFMNVNVPIIYFVDYFPSLQDNLIWYHMRDIKDDLVLDSHGNLLPLSSIIDRSC